MVAAIVVGLLVLLLAPMAVYDQRQRARGRTVMPGRGNPREDVAGFSGFSGFGGGDGGFGGG